MNVSKDVDSRPGVSARRSSRGHVVLTRHFGFCDREAKLYLTRAAKRERRKLKEIESAVIAPVYDLV